MARWAIAVAPVVGFVRGTLMGARELAPLLGDRAANRECFDGEALVRLPRRMARLDYWQVKKELFGHPLG